MRQQTVGAFISFATKQFIAVHREFIEHHLFLGRRLFHELRERRLDRIALSRMHFEVRMKTEEWRLHNTERNLPDVRCRTPPELRFPIAVSFMRADFEIGLAWRISV